MSRYVHLNRRRVIAVLIALVGTTLPATARAGATDQSLRMPLQAEPDDPTVLALAAELGISPELAAGRLELQHEAGVVADQLAAAFPDTFGGRWFGEDGRVKLGLTVPAATAAAVGVDSQLADSMDVVPVRFSLAQLEKVSREINLEIERGLLTGIEAGVDTSINAVVLSLTPANARAYEQLLDAAVNRLGEMIATEELPAGWTVEEAACGVGAYVDHCDPPLRGGVAISHGGDGCTSAFMAKSRSDAKRFMMTAGHCRDGTLPNMFRAREANGTLHDIGPWHNGNPGAPNDWAIVQVNSTFAWNPGNIEAPRDR